jgi:hypothetical protein
MRNTTMTRRLKKLEANRPCPDPWIFDAAEIQRVALAKLSPADRELFPELYVIRSPDYTDAHSTAWRNWEVALAAALVETKSSLLLAAQDWEFWNGPEKR